MITYYAIHNHALYSLNEEELKNETMSPIWIDINSPTPEEEKLIASIFNINISPDNEVRQIKLPSCYYQQKGEVYAKINIAVDGKKMETVAIILTKDQIITTQLAGLPTSRDYINYIIGNHQAIVTPKSIFAYLIEARINDIDEGLTAIADSLDHLSEVIFYEEEDTAKKIPIDFKSNISYLGKNGHNISKHHESLISISKALNFLALSDQIQSSSIELEKFNDLLHEVSILEEHISFLTDKIAFLLDITFGMLDIEQNLTSKVFSVAALVFLPPAIIASIFGMNFDKIPLLHSDFGFVISILLIIISAALPYKFCKAKHLI